MYKTFSASMPAEVREYCERENFEASCPPHQVIIMQYGRYGRMNKGRCVTKVCILLREFILILF